MFSAHFAITLAYVSMATTIVMPALFLILRIKASTKSNRILFSYFVLAALAEIILLTLQQQGINNMTVINSFTLIQFALLSMFFIFLNQNKKSQIIFALCALVIFMFCLVHLVFVNSYETFDSISLTVENIALAVFSGAILVTLTKRLEIPLLKNPAFWFTTAIFFYFSISVAVSCSANILFEDHTHLRKYTWVINSFLTIISNILYAIGLLCLPKKKT